MVAHPGKYSIKLKWLTPLLPVFSGLGVVFFYSQPGLSHGAIATVTQTFSVEANYSSGQPMALAQVAVYSPENPDEPWTTGQTNAQGEFEFSPDTPGNWDVVIRQAGHGTSVSVLVNPSVAQTAAAAQPATTAAIVSSSESLTHPLQRWASAGAALWGLIGTVLFFSRGKKS